VQDTDRQFPLLASGKTSVGFFFPFIISIWSEILNEGVGNRQSFSVSRCQTPKRLRQFSKKYQWNFNITRNLWRFCVMVVFRVFEFLETQRPSVRKVIRKTRDRQLRVVILFFILCCFFLWKSYLELTCLRASRLTCALREMSYRFLFLKCHHWVFKISWRNSAWMGHLRGVISSLFNPGWDYKLEVI